MAANMTRLKCLLLLLLLGTAYPQPLVVVSVDGLNPEFYRSEEYRTPVLQRLAREGAWAEAVYPVFPSFTYPNHTALVTGCRPARHGIVSNVIEDGPRWFWEAEHIKVPTLWEAAHDQGLSVAMLSWPVSVGAEVDFLVPEVFQVHGIGPSTEELLQEHSTPGLLERFQVKVKEDFVHWDGETTRTAVGLLKEEQVDLMLIHFIQVDKAQHDYGPEHYKVGRAIARIDEYLGQIEAAAGSEATLVVLGDHGFRSYTHYLRPKGWLKDHNLENLARVKTTGGSAAVYTESDKVLEFFRAPRDGVARVLEEEELKELGAFPGARLGLVAEEGYIFSRKAEGPRRTDRVKGQHGYLPQDVPTGLIIHGPRLAPNTKIGKIDIIQIAPTLAHLLGISLPSAEGQSFLETE